MPPEEFDKWYIGKICKLLNEGKEVFDDHGKLLTEVADFLLDDNPV